MFEDVRICRPPGKGTSRKSHRSLGSSDATSSRYPNDDIRDHMVAIVGVKATLSTSQQKTLQIITEEARNQTEEERK